MQSQKNTELYGSSQHEKKGIKFRHGGTPMILSLLEAANSCSIGLAKFDEV